MPGPFYDATAEIEGRVYRGTRTLKQGGLVCVAWPEGFKTVELGKTRPEVKAVTCARWSRSAWRTARESTPPAYLAGVGGRGGPGPSRRNPHARD